MTTEELRKAQAEIEQLVLNMAMISTIACKQELDWYPTQQPWERAALRDVVNLIRSLKECRAEIEQLKTRVGWLDHLDTEEGRRMHANEALLVENEQLKAELSGVRDMLLDVANSGIEIELRQYTTVQINRTMWDKIQEWAKDKEPT